MLYWDFSFCTGAKLLLRHHDRSSPRGTQCNVLDRWQSAKTFPSLRELLRLEQSPSAKTVTHARFSSIWCLLALIGSDIFPTCKLWGKRQMTAVSITNSNDDRVRFNKIGISIPQTSPSQHLRQKISEWGSSGLRGRESLGSPLSSCQILRLPPFPGPLCFLFCPQMYCWLTDPITL